MPDYCQEDVFHSGMWGGSRCSRNANKDPVDGTPTRCWQHSEQAKRERKAEYEVKAAAESALYWAARRRASAGQTAALSYAAQLLGELDRRNVRGLDDLRTKLSAALADAAGGH